MRETLVVIGLFVLAVALRSARKAMMRKLGAIMILVATYFLFYFLTGSIWWGIAGAATWFLLPWFELLTRVRQMRLPLDNRLFHKELPNPNHFPNAAEASAAMEEAGFDHVSDCGWEWSGMRQFFRLYWHPEERAIASVCLCEQCDVAFAFISITSYDGSGKIWRTTNFPFAPTLLCPPEIRWHHVPCEKSCFHQILEDHRDYLARMKVPQNDLRMPDPDEIENGIEREMRRQVDHNLSSGIIRLTGDGHFKYSVRGLFFLWGQFIKDMVKLC